ncbi:MAG: hypothetical protein M3O70_08400 [Actinomycetota bacterium]|nr:hypothetical protein [Actinomycetota bacterium]
MSELDERPLEDLTIESVDWTHRAEHIRTRSERYGRSELDVEPEWATEAALEPNRLIDRASERSIVVIGLSLSAPPRHPQDEGRLLKVWLVPKDLDLGDWWGASACEANASDRRQYWEKTHE